LKGLFQLQGESLENTEGFPTLSNGTHGYIWGTNSAKGCEFFNGLYGNYELEPDGDLINVCNFRIIEKCQEFHPRDEKVDMLIKVAKNDVKGDGEEVLAELIRDGYVTNDNGETHVAFPVFTEAQFNGLVDLMAPAIETIKESIKSAVSESTKVVQNHAPAKLHDACPAVSGIKYRMDSVGRIVEEMCSQGYLMVPESTEKLGMYAVLK